MRSLLFRLRRRLAYWIDVDYAPCYACGRHLRVDFEVKTGMGPVCKDHLGKPDQECVDKLF